MNQKQNKLEILREQLIDCKKCSLHKLRKNVVFGDGNPNASIMLISEGPGYYEDQQGKTFVGKSGQLLDKILIASGFKREEHLFIANIVKCRPPNNRDPLPDERDACLAYLYQQIEIIDPKIIILLGSTALKGLVDQNAKITKVRGKWLEWNHRLLMPTYHPSALLRNQSLKRPVWEDFIKVIDKYRELIDPKHYSAYH